MDNFDLKKYLAERTKAALGEERVNKIHDPAEGRLTESASDKAFKNLIGALSKYKNVRAGSQDPVDDETYGEVEELIRQL